VIWGAFQDQAYLTCQKQSTELSAALLH
jgi:hypothetical protein